MSVTLTKIYRFQTVESERGWKTEYEYLYFDTLEEAQERYKELQPKNIPTPEWYYIASGPIEKIDENGNWK